MESYRNKGHNRLNSLDSDNDLVPRTKAPSNLMANANRSRRKPSLPFSHPRPPLTPNTSSMPQLMSNPLPPSAPASPPTPAPSPTPHQRSPTAWRLTPLEDVEDPVLEDARQVFARLDHSAKEDWLRSLVDICDNQALSFLHRIVSPRLKKDPFKKLPNELCFRVCVFTFEKWNVLKWLTDPRIYR